MPGTANPPSQTFPGKLSHCVYFYAPSINHEKIDIKGWVTLCWHSQVRNDSKMFPTGWYLSQILTNNYFGKNKIQLPSEKLSGAKKRPTLPKKEKLCSVCRGDKCHDYCRPGPHSPVNIPPLWPTRWAMFKAGLRLRKVGRRMANSPI